MTVPPDARPLGPGIYALGAELHVDAEELLASQGLDASVTSQDVLERVVREVCAREGIAVDAVETVL